MGIGVSITRIAENEFLFLILLVAGFGWRAVLLGEKAA
jgi:hypothetical protein